MQRVATLTSSWQWLQAQLACVRVPLCSVSARSACREWLRAGGADLSTGEGGQAGLHMRRQTQRQQHQRRQRRQQRQRFCCHSAPLHQPCVPRRHAASAQLAAQRMGGPGCSHRAWVPGCVCAGACSSAVPAGHQSSAQPAALQRLPGSSRPTWQAVPVHALQISSAATPVGGWVLRAVGGWILRAACTALVSMQVCRCRSAGAGCNCSQVSRLRRQPASGRLGGCAALPRAGRAPGTPSRTAARRHL